MGCTNSTSASNPVADKKAVMEELPAPVRRVPKQKSATSRDAFMDRYDIGDQLGKGAYSSVKLAVMKETGDKVAMKITDRARLDPEDEQGLKQEMEILDELDHPHVVKMIDHFEDKDNYYEVLELIEGGELFERIVKKDVYSEKEARDLVHVLISAIKYCHDHGVVHRDLKPENLMMLSKDDDLHVKIVDFGFAKKQPTGGFLSTQCGSPAYIAPEILKKEPYGKPCDMWSIGVITFILLGGYAPFDDNTQVGLFRKIRRGKFSFYPEYWNHVSEQAKDLIKGLLNVDPAARLSAGGALKSPWLRESTEALARKSLKPTLSQFKHFQAQRKFKAAARAVIAMNKMKALEDLRKNAAQANEEEHDEAAVGGDQARPSFLEGVFCFVPSAPPSPRTDTGKEKEDEQQSAVFANLA